MKRQISHDSFASKPDLGRAAAPGPKPLDIWVSDPWCRTPWYTAELTRALALTANHVRLVCPSYHLEPRFLQHQGLKPRPGVLNVAAHLATIHRNLVAPARAVEYGVNSLVLALIAAMHPPHVVHQQQCALLEHGWVQEIAQLRWLRWQGTRIVHTVHNLLPHKSREFHSQRFGELYRLCDALICHDGDTAFELHKDFGIARERIHVIPHGPLFARLPAMSVSECRKAIDIPGDVQVFLAQGVIAPYKGLDLLLEAWANLLRSDRTLPRAMLLIAGTGAASCLRQLRQKALDLGLGQNQVRMDLRYIAAAEVPIYMQAADVLLYPYRSITTSGALLTGLNFRKPIIASDLPPMRKYLFPHVNALIVPPGNLDALTSALAEARSRTNLAALQAGSASNQFLQVQWDEIATRTIEVYREVLR